jgi:hypothetical protein
MPGKDGFAAVFSGRYPCSFSEKTGGSVISGSFAWSFQYVLRPSDVVGIPDNANIFLSFFPERKKGESSFSSCISSRIFLAPFLTYLRTVTLHSVRYICLRMAPHVSRRIISSSLLHLHSLLAVGMFLGVSFYIYFPHVHVDFIWFILNECHYFQFDLQFWTLHEDISENFRLKHKMQQWQHSIFIIFYRQLGTTYQHYK